MVASGTPWPCRNVPAERRRSCGVTVALSPVRLIYGSAGHVHHPVADAVLRVRLAQFIHEDKVRVQPTDLAVQPGRVTQPASSTSGMTRTPASDFGSPRVQPRPFSGSSAFSTR